MRHAKALERDDATIFSKHWKSFCEFHKSFNWYSLMKYYKVPYSIVAETGDNKDRPFLQIEIKLLIIFLSFER